MDIFALAGLVGTALGIWGAVTIWNKLFPDQDEDTQAQVNKLREDRGL